MTKAEAEKLLDNFGAGVVAHGLALGHTLTPGMTIDFLLGIIEIDRETGERRETMKQQRVYLTLTKGMVELGWLLRTTMGAVHYTREETRTGEPVSALPLNQFDAGSIEEALRVMGFL